MGKVFGFIVVLGLAIGLVVVLRPSGSAMNSSSVVPKADVDAKLAPVKGSSSAVFAGGCFWGIQAVFKHVKGVTAVTSGYAGGTVDRPDYETVSSGGSGHAESVKIVYDPSQITYGQLLRVFFAVAHNPTELNRQGPDVGTQYRSAIFYADAEQQRIAEAYVKQLDKAKVFPRPIVTQVVALKQFFAAEDYHQDYAEKHPDNPYVQQCDLPKMAALKRDLPELYVEK